jgi:hypothetical protein
VGLEAALKGLQHVGDVLVQVSHLTCHGPHEFGLVGWQMCQVLRPFGMMDL